MSMEDLRDALKTTDKMLKTLIHEMDTCSLKKGFHQNTLIGSIERQDGETIQISLVLSNPELEI